MSRSQRTGFLVCSFPATTVETGKYGDRESGIQIHGPLRQHCSPAFIASFHRRTLALSQKQVYPPEVLGTGLFIVQES